MVEEAFSYSPEEDLRACLALSPDPLPPLPAKQRLSSSHFSGRIPYFLGDMELPFPLSSFATVLSVVVVPLSPTPSLPGAFCRDVYCLPYTRARPPLPSAKPGVKRMPRGREGGNWVWVGLGWEMRQFSASPTNKDGHGIIYSGEVRPSSSN